MPTPNSYSHDSDMQSSAQRKSELPPIHRPTRFMECSPIVAEAASIGRSGVKGRRATPTAMSAQSQGSSGGRFSFGMHVPCGKGNSPSSFLRQQQQAASTSAHHTGGGGTPSLFLGGKKSHHQRHDSSPRDAGLLDAMMMQSDDTVQQRDGHRGSNGGSGEEQQQQSESHLDLDLRRDSTEAIEAAILAMPGGCEIQTRPAAERPCPSSSPSLP